MESVEPPSTAEANAGGVVPDSTPWWPGSDISAEEERSVADGRRHSVDPASITVASKVSWIVTAVITLVASMGVLLLALLAPIPAWGFWLIGSGYVLLVLTLSLLATFWPRLDWKHTAYRVTPMGIEIWKGVLWRQAITVPRSRVQHTDVNQGPMQRSHGIATLIIHTAGTQHAYVELDGLPHEKALRIRDYLIRGGEGDAV